MFEKYIEQKEQNLAELINITADYVNLFGMIFNPKIEQAYKTYFSAEVDWWLYEEQIGRTSNLRFNFDDPKLNTFLKQMDELYKKNARFSTVTLPLVISSAVKARLNYLCRPRTALKWFVYRWDQTKTYHEIIKRLNYLDDYKYLTEGFVEYIRRNNLIKTHDDLINMSMFDKIINEIDNSMLSELSPEGFLQLLGPLFAFFNSDSDHQDTAKIPVEAVIIFFDDKNMMSLSTKLESQFRSGELLLISKKYLLGFIYKSLYDADNMYGGGADNITKVTNEIEQVNSNFMNIANSLKENLSKNQDLGKFDKSDESDEIDENLISDDSYDYNAENVDNPNENETQNHEEVDLDFSNLNLSSFSKKIEQNSDDNEAEITSDDSVSGFDLSEFGFESDSIPADAIDNTDLQMDIHESQANAEPTAATIVVSDASGAIHGTDEEMIARIAAAVTSKKKSLLALVDTLKKEI